MLNAFYAGVKGVQPRATVVAASTAPFGDARPGGPRMAPALFFRELVSASVHLDAIDHHPYSVGGPFRKALNRDDVSVPDLGKLTVPLRRAERAGRVLPRGRHKQVWITEFSWDSAPPDPEGVPMRRLAKWLPEALYLFDRAGPAAGTLVVERRSGGRWRQVTSAKLARGQTLTRSLPLSSTGPLRARLGAATSLTT